MNIPKIDFDAHDGFDVTIARWLGRGSHLIWKDTFTPGDTEYTHVGFIGISGEGDAAEITCGRSWGFDVGPYISLDFQAKLTDILSTHPEKLYRADRIAPSLTASQHDMAFAAEVGGDIAPLWIDRVGERGVGYFVRVAKVGQEDEFIIGRASDRDGDMQVTIDARISVSDFQLEETAGFRM